MKLDITYKITIDDLVEDEDFEEIKLMTSLMKNIFMEMAMEKINKIFLVSELSDNTKFNSELTIIDGLGNMTVYDDNYPF